MKVVMFSGGLDSLVTALKLQDKGEDFRLFSVDMGFNHKELGSMKLLVDKFKWWDKWDIFRDKGLLESFLEKENNNYIPYRNFQFVMWADMFYRKYNEDMIYYLGGLKEDLIEDNTESGRYEMGKCLTALNSGGRIVVVSSIISDSSKPDLVKWILNKFNYYKEGLDIIVMSNSCYTVENCGECNACLRKYFALKSAKFDANWEILFRKDPRNSDTMRKYVERIKSGIHNSGMEEGRYIYTQQVLKGLGML